MKLDDITLHVKSQNYTRFDKGLEENPSPLILIMTPPNVKIEGLFNVGIWD